MKSSETYQMENSKTKRRVVLYTAFACQQCNEVRNYLLENGIDFIEKDVIEDQSAAIEMMRKSRKKGVPQAIIDDIPVYGYDRFKLDKLFSK